MIFSTLAQMVGSLWAAQRISSKIIQQADDWFKLTLSLSGSASVTFLSTMSLVGGGMLGGGSPAGIALAGGFFAACGATAAVIYGLWRRSPLTRGIPLFVPMQVAKDELASGGVYLEPKK